MKKLALSLLFLLPAVSFASTIDEQRHALVTQLIILIQQEISILQAQLAAQVANTSQEPVLGATAPSVDPLPAQINQLATQLQNLPTKTMAETPTFQLFTSNLQPDSVRLVTNQPVETITGDSVIGFTAVPNGDTVYRNSKDPAWTYEVHLTNVEPGVEFSFVVTDANGIAITKSLILQ